MRALRRGTALLAFSFGSLSRRWGKNTAVAFALALVTCAFASVIALTDSLRNEARLEMNEMPDLTVARLHGGRPALMSTGDVAAIPLDGIASIRPRIWGYLFVEGLSSNLVVVGVPPARVTELVTPIMHGRAIAPNSRGWIVIGEGVSKTLGALPGDGIGLGTPPNPSIDLTVAGTFHRDSSLTTADVALMDDRDARELLGFGAQEATDIAIALTNPDESSVVARKISAAIPGARVVERRSLARAYDLTYGTRGGLVALALLPALIALIVLAWDRATGLSIEERREVGVLKTIGWSTRDIITQKLTEAVFIAVAAASIGALSAYGYVFVLHAPGLLRALLGWSALYPTFELAPAADGSSLVSIAALTVAPYIAAAVIPAWRSATIDPSEAMRG